MRKFAPSWSDWWDVHLRSKKVHKSAELHRLRAAPFIFEARDAQRPPQGDWRTWLFMGGRGAGKTRAGAEWTRFSALFGGAERVALVGPTLGDVREVMIEGPSGLRAIEPDEDKRPVYHVSRRQLEWDNGAKGFAFSAEDPDSLRGPQFHAAWCDEIGVWAKGETVWNNLQLGLRLGDAPRCVATTTPRPVPLVQKLAKAGAVITHDHLDYEAALGSLENEDYLRSQLIGGEAYDWYYASGEAREAQVRSPIEDTAHGEDWMFRQKDVRGWWANAHYERPGGRQASEPTAWVPASKPIRMIEIGFPAVDKGTNSPNLFYDPKSSESAVPPFSNGARDDLLQRRALSVATRFWASQPMVEQVLVWAWDGRPWPDFPARGEVWSDGDNWQFGHWLNGRTGLIDLSETVEDMALKGGTQIDARLLSGIIDGFAIEGATSLASALSPLATAYECDISETVNGLTAQHEGVVSSAALSEADTLEDSVQRTRILLDKQPSAVSLNYISGDGRYQQAVVEARASGANTGVTLSYRMPLVMSETRAKALADRMLDQDLKLETLSLALPPGQASGLEVADRVEYQSDNWIVARIEEQGLERQIKLRQPKLSFERVQALDFPNADLPSIVSAEPFGKFIDIPAFDHLESAPPYIAVTADPWRGALPIKVGPDALEMTERGIVSAPAGIGRLEASLAPAPSDTWDETNVIELYMPGEVLSSWSDAAILAGQNRLLIEHQSGWELLAWRDAELVGTDLWQLRGLQRGLLGTDIQDVSEGACAILADSRLVPVRMIPSDIGQAQYWRVGEGDLQPFTYRDAAGRFT